MKKSTKFMGILALLMGMLFIPHITAEAHTIGYQDADGNELQLAGNPIQDNSTAANPLAAITAAFADADFTDVHGTLIGIVDPSNGYKLVSTADAAAVTADVTYKAIGSKDVASNGVIGDDTDPTKCAKWYITKSDSNTDGTLFVLGDGTNTVTGTGGSGTDEIWVRTSFNGDSFDIGAPEIAYGDILNDAWGIKQSYVGEEKEREGLTYYDYVQNPYDADDGYRRQAIDNRDALQTESRIRFAVPATTTVTWAGDATKIGHVVFGNGLKLAGNLSYMFNGNTTTVEDRPYANYSTIGKSLYVNLHDVQILADMSDVTSIAGMFARCPGLVRVFAGDAPASYTLTKLMYTSYLFLGDENLAAMDGEFLDKLDLSTAPLVNTDFMFGGCTDLSMDNVNLKSFKMDGVVSADGMFYGCDDAGILFNATDLNNNVGLWDVSSLHTAKFMFSGVVPRATSGIDFVHIMDDIDPGLEPYTGGNVISGTVDLFRWDTSNLEEGYAMFAKNDGITEVNLVSDPLAATPEMPKLLDASCMFLLDQNLARVNGDGWRTPKLVYTTAMFKAAGRNVADTVPRQVLLDGWDCPLLQNTDMMFTAAGYQKVDLDNTDDFSTVTDAVAMFSDMPNLTSVGEDALGHARFTNISSAAYMFHNDTKLAALKPRDWGMDNVVTLEHMFDNCTLLELRAGDTDELSISPWNISDQLVNMECFAYKTGATAIDISGWDTSNCRNMFMAFAYCPELQTFTAPSGATSLSAVTTMNGMLCSDPKLESATGFKSGSHLVDARGIFAEDIKLSEADVKDLVDSSVDATAFMFRNNRLLASLDLSNWNTSGVKFMQGMCDGCNALAALTTGASWSGARLQDIGCAFRNNYVLPSSALNTLLSRFDNSANLADLYEMAKNDYALTSLDLSPLDLSAATNLTRMAAMEEDGAYDTLKLTTIKVPSSILTAPGVVLTEGGTSINMFWLKGDESSANDDHLTHFFVKGDTVPANLLSYPFGGANGDNDNREFTDYRGRTINGEDIGTYTMRNASDSATLAVNADSTFYKGGTDAATATKVPLSFLWQKGDDNVPGTTSTKVVANSDIGGTAPVTYTAYMKPSLLTGSNAGHTANFVLTPAAVHDKGIEATYKGVNIVSGNQYSKDDVEVIYTDADGNKTTLTSTQWTADSQDVVEGTNTFTATYNPGDGALTDTFTVTGVPAGAAFISAVYEGEPVSVGKEYKKADVTVTYTTAAGTTVTVSPSAFSVDSLEVKKLGDNTYTASYKPSGSTVALTDTFKVTGKEPDPYITATYDGDPVLVGSDLPTDDVEVVLTLSDGSEVVLTPDDYTIEPAKVTKEGDNTFTVTYHTADGDLKDTFKVKGIRAIGSISAEYVGPSVLVGEAYNTANIITTAYYADDPDHLEGFEVTPTSYSTRVVKQAGDNTVVVSYKDPDSGKVFTAPVVINGYRPVASITAQYLGEKIKVGSSYNKDKVKVTLFYSDGGESATTRNFTVDSTTVSYEGDNTFVATYKDPYGSTYSASFTVPGYTDSSSSSSSSSSKKDRDRDRDRDRYRNRNSSMYNPYTGQYYAPLSSVFDPNGTGTATGLNPITYGSSTGAVRTGTTGKTVFYAVAVILALSALIYAVYWKRKNKHDRDE